jgi:hypothetical protein
MSEQPIRLEDDYGVTTEQVVHFYEKGWVSLPRLLNKEAVETLRGRLATAETRSQKRGPSGGPASPNINHDEMAWRDPVFHDVATSRRMASAATALMKQDAVLFVEDVSFFKPAHGSASRFHQDFSYWPFDRKGAITVWIALVDMSEDMGPLRYLEGSHLEGPLGFDDGGDIRETYPQLRDRRVGGGEPLSAGDAQVHWDLTIHGAGPNDTDDVREAYTLRYIRTDTVYTGLSHPHFDSFQLNAGRPFSESSAFALVGAAGGVES